MNINIIKELFELISNKHQRGGITGEEFNSLFRTAELNYQEYLIGLLRQFTYQKAAPRIGTGNGRRVSTKLSPFRTVYTDTVNAGTGRLTKPADIIYTEGMVRASDNKLIKFIESNRLSQHINSTTSEIANNPVYLEFYDYWQVYPISIGDANVTIISYPIPSVWNFTTTSGREVYNPVGSTDPTWHDEDIYEIVARMLKAWGASTKDGEILQFAQSLITQGE